MEREAFSDSKAINQTSKYVPVKLDAEKDGAQTASKYGIDSYPSFVVLTPSGEHKTTFSGYKTAPEWVDRINLILTESDDNKRIEEALAANPNDPMANAELSIRLIEAGKLQEAKTHLNIPRKVGHKSHEFAKALSNLGQLVARANLKEGISLLEESLAQNDPTTTSITFERIIYANLYANLPQNNEPLFPRILSSEFTSPELKARASNAIKSVEYAPKVASPNAIVEALIDQLQFTDNRDPYYFKTLFMDESPISIPLGTTSDSPMMLATNVDDFITVFGIDKLKTQITISEKDVVILRNTATAQLKIECNQVLPNGTPQSPPYLLNLHLIKNGTRWYIRSFLMERI